MNHRAHGQTKIIAVGDDGKKPFVGLPRLTDKGRGSWIPLFRVGVCRNHWLNRWFSGAPEPLDLSIGLKMDMLGNERDLREGKKTENTV